MTNPLPKYRSEGPDLLANLARDLGHHKKLSIEEFADTCKKTLYPRQLLLLKLIFLEELTPQEEDVLSYWIAGGRGGNEIVISPLIRERMDWLRGNNYEHFREVVLVGGRRSGKGHMTAIAGAYMMYNLLDIDVMDAFNIDADHSLYFSCIAASQDQAKAAQYTDFASTVSSCDLMQEYIFKIRETEFSVLTEYDKRKTKELEARMGRIVGKDMSKLRGVALAANAKTVRGLAHMMAILDEMAHMQQEGSSYMTATAVYDALTPSLLQFGKNSLCNPPEAPIWMGDLSFKPIGEVEVGDKVVGWTDTVGPTGKITKDLTTSFVTNVMRRMAPLVKVTMESGRTFRCTPDHRWLTLSYGGKKDFKGHSHQRHICRCGVIYESKASFAAHIRECNKHKDSSHGLVSRDGYYTQGREWFCVPEVGRNLVHVIDPTPSLPSDLQHHAAWLGGIFDGEGSANRNQAVVLSQYQSNHANVYEHIGHVLDMLDIDYSITPKWYSLRSDNDHNAKQMVVNFANWTNPIRRQALIDKVLVGRWRQSDRIVAVESDGYGEVVALTTSTGNYVANGYASKNCMLNSSPYTKVGKFYEKYLEAMKVVDGRPANYWLFTIQYPSWSIYEGYRDIPNPIYRKVEMASPDWNENEVDKNGVLIHSPEDIDAILLARNEEQSDPIKFKVENRSQWAEVLDAFLQPEMVDRAFMGRPRGDGQYDDFKVNWSMPVAGYDYYCHLDPSSTTAGFGFVMAHTEQFPEIDPKGELVWTDHLCADIIKRWLPKQFMRDGQGSEMVFDYEWVLEEISHWMSVFRPVEVTVDQFGSKVIIAWLSRWCKENDMGHIRIFEKTATARSNHTVAMRFRDALGLDRVHLPSDTPDCDWLALELKNLQIINSQGGYAKIECPTVGPVQTKDIYAALSQVCYSLIGDTTVRDNRGMLSAVKPAMGAQGGYQIGGSKLQRRSLASIRPELGDKPSYRQTFDPGVQSVNMGNWVRKGRRF